VDNRYVETYYSSRSKTTVISFHIPGVRIAFLKVPNKPTEILSRNQGTTTESILIGVRYGINAEIQRLDGVKGCEKWVQDLKRALDSIEELAVQSYKPEVKLV
jgi:hypothetical protein